MCDPKFISFTGLSQNFPNVEKSVHPAALAISVKKSPLQHAGQTFLELLGILH